MLTDNHMIRGIKYESKLLIDINVKFIKFLYLDMSNYI